MTPPAFPPFQTLLDEHGPLVWRVCRAALGAVDGDDCFQDTMLAALRAYPTLRHAENLRGWLLTIANHQVIDHHRRQNRRREDRLAADGEVHDVEATDRGGLAQLIDGDGLWPLVRSLPLKQRAAIVHRYVADLPYAEIATLLDCSEAAARQNVRAGLANLRRIHQEEPA